MIRGPQRIVLHHGRSYPCVCCGREATADSLHRGEFAAALDEFPDRYEVVAVVCADHFRSGPSGPEWRPAMKSFCAAVDRYGRE